MSAPLRTGIEVEVNEDMAKALAYLENDVQQLREAISAVFIGCASDGLEAFQANVPHLFVSHLGASYVSAVPGGQVIPLVLTGTSVNTEELSILKCKVGLARDLFRQGWSLRFGIDPEVTSRVGGQFETVTEDLRDLQSLIQKSLGAEKKVQQGHHRDNDPPNDEPENDRDGSVTPSPATMRNDTGPSIEHSCTTQQDTIAQSHYVNHSDDFVFFPAEDTPSASGHVAPGLRGSDSLQQSQSEKKGNPAFASTSKENTLDLQP